MIMRAVGGALTACCLAMAAPATAGVTLLTSPAQISTSYLNDFETVGSSGPVTFTTGSRWSATSANSGGTSSGSWGYGVFPPTNIEASLSTYFTEVGMFFGNDDRCCEASTDAVVSVYDGVNFLGSVSLAANMNDTADQFIGLGSTDPFNRVVVSYTSSNLFRYIDDFQLGPEANDVPAVPEPSTWAMMLLGFGFVGGAMRARRRQKLTVSYA